MLAVLKGLLGGRNLLVLGLVLPGLLASYKWYQAIGEKAVAVASADRLAAELVRVQQLQAEDERLINELNTALQQSHKQTHSLSTRLKEARKNAPKSYQDCADVQLPDSVRQLLRSE